MAWAVEAHWDIEMGTDQRVAVIVPVAQHPDLLRAGVVTLPAGAMFDSVTDAGRFPGGHPSAAAARPVLP